MTKCVPLYLILLITSKKLDNIEKLQCLTFEAEVEARIRLNWKNELRWFPNTSLTNDLTNFWINCKLFKNWPTALEANLEAKLRLNCQND